MARTRVTDKDNPLRQRKGWRASTKVVPVHCPQCKGKQRVQGIAAENAIRNDTPYQFRAVCSNCGTPLVRVGKK